MAAARGILAALAAASLVLEYGFRLPPGAKVWVDAFNVAIVVLFCAQVGAAWMWAASRRAHAKAHGLELALAGLLIAHSVALYVFRSKLAAALPGFDLARAYLLVAQLYLLIMLLLDLARAYSGAAAWRVHPGLVLVGSFGAVIVAGTLLLLLPRAAEEGARRWSVLDAFFTSTSAVCVTGLTVRDTGSELSRAGQSILLGLIQIGGLGLATLAAFLALMRQRGLGVRELVLLRGATGQQEVGAVARFLLFVVVFTLGAEALGAVVLAAETGGGTWWAVFHSVSSFCNAGFSLQPDSLAEYASSPVVMATMMGLVVVGGLGFPVLVNLGQVAVARLRGERRRLSVHTRAALAATVVLLAAGMLLMLALGAVRPLSALFHSVTARTAGFQIADLETLPVPAHVALIVLMAIGAGPVSTGGGMKTVSVVVLAATVGAMLRNREHVEMFRRTIPRAIVNAAVSTAALYGASVLAGSVLLSITDPAVPYRKLLFETVSALSTVGLSTGITASLSAGGKLVLCAAMFVGRIGPLVILTAVAGRPPSVRYEYPEESVLVG